ncbi:MAG: hypothetical protein PHW04_07130 [Candidatus Wallbacteria bacterium]|nr:hypothetical protein [Candidatus Wallbacteria bacterium]
MKKLFLWTLLCPMILFAGGFKQLEINGIKLSNHQGGIYLYSDDLKEGQIKLNGLVDTAFPVQTAEISWNAGETWDQMLLNNNKICHVFSPDQFPRVYQLMIRCECSNHEKVITATIFPVRWTAAGIHELLLQKTESFFRSLEREEREEILSYFSRSYPFFYRLEDAVTRFCNQKFILGYSLFFGPVRQNGLGWEVELDWEKTQGGICTKGFDRLSFKRESDGEFRIYRVTGNNLPD